MAAVDKSRRFGTVASVLLAGALLATALSGGASAGATTIKDKYGAGDPVKPVTESADTYETYLKDMDGKKDYRGDPISMAAETFKASREGDFFQETEGKAALVWDEAARLAWVEWTCRVETPGFYNFELEYCTLAASSLAPRRNVTIDGELVYEELANLEFPALFKDKSGPWKDAIGDEIASEAESLPVWQTRRATDQQGQYPEALKVYLEAGEHTLRLEYVSEYMAVAGLRLVAPRDIRPYAEVLEAYRKQGYRRATAADIRLDGEKPDSKSDISLLSAYSSDPKADPHSATNKIMNVIGGNNWGTPGQEITWRFTVPEDGLYRIDLRVYAHLTEGLSVERQILVDGEVPFREFLSYTFAYADWRTVGLRDGEGKPYMVYLTAGADHTLTLRAQNTYSREIINNLKATLNNLSSLTQRVMTVTGANPDPNFDYRFEEKIPGVGDDLRAIADSLDFQIDCIGAMTKKGVSTTNDLKNILYTVRRMIDDPFSIARNLRMLTDAQTTLSKWLLSFNKAPLQLDFIVIGSPDTATKDYKASFFDKLGAVLQSFAVSFIRDYDSVGGPPGQDGETISIWVSKGQQWGELLKNLCDRDFTPRHNITVNANIVPAGQLGTGGILMMSFASGTAPDVAIGVDMMIPTEYGMRDGALDVSGMAGFDEVKERFLPGSLNPYYFQNGVYGLPETIDFNILFYRKDILEALNIELPDTWEDVFVKVIPVLKRNGMDFWYEGGFNQLLFQNGGDLYTEDGSASGLDTPQALQAFRRFTDMYTVYEVPTAAEFYNRFRSGQMPIGVSTFTTYIKLMKAAPELQGRWGVSMIPGTLREDGRVDRTNGNSGTAGVNTSGTGAGTSTAAMIMSSTKKAGAAWTFLKWYTEAGVQTRYAENISAYIGDGTIWSSANVEAFDKLPVDTALKDVIKAQREFYRDPYNVVGGYITARHVENARVRTVVKGMNFREAMEISVREINTEIRNKNAEFAARRKNTQ